MNREQSIAWLEDALQKVRASVFSWAMAGWPCCANSYRRDARKLQRMIQRLQQL